MEILIDEKHHGATVLEVIRSEAGISRAHLKHLKFSEGGILVNGSHATVRRILSCGDRLFLSTDDEEGNEAIDAVDIPLDILYEDSDCVVPSKTADMPTHPSHGHYGDTVANALAFKYKSEGIPFVFRPINRLDRNTSGLLLIAKNRRAAGFLCRSMSEGDIKKAYIAILCGLPKDSDGYIETYMRRTAESIIVRENCGEGEGGDYALTKYKVICVTDTHSLVIAMPITGRTHQLRVHFSGIGCPILGDDMYGDISDLIPRHALHSAALSFPRVSDTSAVTLTSPLPNDMENAATSIFGRLPDDLYEICRDFLFETDRKNSQ